MKIVAFTNLKQAGSVSLNLPNGRKTWFNREKFAIFEDGELKFLQNVTKSTTSPIILVNDSINENFDDLKTLIGNDQDIYIIYHGTRLNKNADYKTNMEQEYPSAPYVRDSHVGGSVYEMLWECINEGCRDEDLKKVVERIKEKAPNPKLNAALEFLHASLGGNPDRDILTKSGFKLDEEVCGNKTLRQLIDDLNGKTNDAYNQALAIVRDALLEQAGVK